ncbi:alpha/beta fold hydrolase [Paenirhodobacter populi]|uniref:Alpha/beta fold hydrolase n=1 Tax=Paenirhodobacter populi TaxID=2306993 RepID=A0A443JQ00_9RHOB|nr:alpha/beta hydrolase [Sinirhodobacter populi]RWR22583.1 alpha/beta fold hydrolase [Sinirhodobacter populi]
MVQFFTADDGARLAYRDEGAGLPVLALSGLTRTMEDFDYVAPWLTGCRLIRMDYRGRGASDFTGAETYTVMREGLDALQLLDHLGVAKAAILGTSRGGLIGMYLAYTAKARMTGLCLNDVGPVLEHAGLMKIFDYLGRNPAAKSMPELIEKLPHMKVGFANVPQGRWVTEAQHHYIERNGRPVINYDPALRQPFIDAFKGEEAPTAWPLFDACEGLPLCVIRGANSDLLSRATVEEMLRRRPDMIHAEVPDRAHVPFLDEPEALAALRAWIAQIAG